MPVPGGCNEARIWSPTSSEPIAVRPFETVEELLRWVDGADVAPFNDERGDGGLVMDCMPYYRSFGIERPDGTRSSFASLGEMVGRCMEEGLVFDGCDVDPADLRSLSDFAGRVGRAAADDPDEGRLVLYVKERP